MPETYKRLQCGEKKGRRERKSGALWGIGNGVSVLQSKHSKFGINTESTLVLSLQKFIISSLKAENTSGTLTRQAPAGLPGWEGYHQETADCSTSGAQCWRQSWCGAELSRRPPFAFASSTVLVPQTGVLLGKCCCQGSGDSLKCSETKILDSREHPDKNITSAKASANGWKRRIPLSSFSKENEQKCQIQQFL